MRRAQEIPLPGSNSTSYQMFAPVTENTAEGTVVHDWIPQDTRTLNKLVRLVYLTDPVVGPAIDFYKDVPFGAVALGGIQDEKRIQFYQDALEALKLERYLPYLAGDILVDGRLVIHLLYNETKGYWQEMICHDSDYIKVQASPLIGEEPIIDLMTPPEYQAWATNPDPRFRAQQKRLNPSLLKLMAAGAEIPLSSANTIFVPRKMNSTDYEGTSLIMRVLQIVFLEWAYLVSEVTGLRRKAAPWTVARVGIEDKWEPTQEEMLAVQDALMAAEEDPVGAKLVFRNGVELDQIGGHTEIAKWLEQWSTLKEAKLQGLGMNEAFATGEASWSYLESMLSLGMERIRNFRNFIATEIIQEGILAPLAKLHGFYKRSQAEIDHNIRTSSTSMENLDIPTVEWSRSLQPTADRDYLEILSMIKDQGVPINIRKWAQAAGYDIDEAIAGFKGDLELRKRIETHNEAVKKISGPEEEEEGGGRWGSLSERLEDLPVWAKAEKGEFLNLTKGELEKFTRHVPPSNGHKPGMKEWKQVEAKLKKDGVRYSKIRTFRYLLTRAGALDAPLPNKTVVKVRDALIKKRLDKVAIKEIGWLNQELARRNIEDPEKLVARATPHLYTAPWARPATPKLLTGEGWVGDEE